MSTRPLTQAIPQTARSISGHKLSLIVAYAAAVTLIVSLSVYGFDYYVLDVAQRPYSPKHLLLKPSGAIGLKLGLLGLVMFVLIFLYPIRKRWPWLGQIGTTRHWLDFHVLLGLAAPFVIAFHSSFKFRGFAGMAFWIMVAVALSGVVGRYLYAQIPQRVLESELSLRESRELQEKLTAKLAGQRLISPSALNPLFRMPSEEQVARLPMLIVMAEMMALDVLRPFRIARLRRRALSRWEMLTTIGGLLRTEHRELEKIIGLARRQAVLSKRVVFFSRAQQVFHLWHVVHRPFSYSFAVLAAIHIGVVWMLGYI